MGRCYCSWTLVMVVATPCPLITIVLVTSIMTAHTLTDAISSQKHRGANKFNNLRLA